MPTADALIRQLSGRVARNVPNPRKPHRFHEELDEVSKILAGMAKIPAMKLIVVETVIELRQEPDGTWGLP